MSTNRLNRLPIPLLSLSFCWVFGFSQLADEEAKDYYQKWLNEDVIYLITEEERDVFLKLQTEAERDHFIEQFWRRRDPDPGNLFNEFKEEHYRRVQYANERFTAGVVGWRTDRGMIYIKYGRPDDIQDYPAGSTYVRPRHEGGGTTLVNPFQIWRYNYIKGIGSDVEIEFVDIHGGNLYRFANDELEKDALLYHPIGLTLSEQLTGGGKSERILTRHFGDLEEKLRNQIGRSPRTKDQPFERMRVLKELQSAPEIKYQDLRRIVTTNIHYSNLPFETQVSFLTLHEEQGLVPLSISVKDSELTFKGLSSGAERATVEIYGMVSSLTNQIVQEFEDTLVRDKVGGSFAGTSIAQKKLVLPAGRYKLTLVVRDANSGRVGTGEFSLLVPTPRGFSSSTLVVADRIEKAASGAANDSLVLSAGYKVIPNMERTFHQGQDLQFYLELYNFAVDQSSSLPSLKVDTKILKDGAEWAGAGPVLSESLNHQELLKDRLLLMKKVPTKTMSSGDYRIVMTFEDQISRQVTVAAVDFKVIQ